MKLEKSQQDQKADKILSKGAELPMVTETKQSELVTFLEQKLE